jgi:hypothetical protein
MVLALTREGTGQVCHPHLRWAVLPHPLQQSRLGTLGCFLLPEVPRLRLQKHLRAVVLPHPLTDSALFELAMGREGPCWGSQEKGGWTDV